MIVGLMPSILVSIIVVYLPGFLFTRAIRIDRISSLIMAPLLSTFYYVVLGILLDQVKFNCSAISLFVIALITSLFFFLIQLIVSHDSSKESKSKIDLIKLKPSFSCLVLLLYISIAFTITYIVFISILETPDALAKYDDNTAHMSMIRSFIGTGSFSTLNNSPTLDIDGQGSFYPSAWHIQVAVTSTIFGNNIPLGLNSTLIVYLVFVIPSGIFFLLDQIATNKKTILFGSLFSISFAAFPWGFVVFGQLLSNLASFSFVPILLASTIGFMRMLSFSKCILRFILIFTCSLFSITIAQPNGLFTFGVWFGIYFMFQLIYDFANNRFIINRKTLLKLTVSLALSILLWVGFFSAPFMSDTVNFIWEANHSFRGAIKSAILFEFTDRSGCQLFMTISVFAGIVCSLFKRRYLWLSIAYLFSFMIYVIGDSSNGLLKHLLAGFWFTDPYRTAAMNGLFAIPLATLGFTGLVDVVVLAVHKFETIIGKSNNQHTKIVTSFTAALLTLIMALFQFSNIASPWIGKPDQQTGLLAVRDYLEWRYASRTWLTSDERDFAKKAMEIIPEGASVINIPNDGSEWLHGAEGLNTLYRRVVFSDMDTQNELIRGSLNQIASSKDVQEAVKEIGSHYVLILDDKSESGNTILDDYAYSPSKWEGIDNINEDTPGFELLLSEGDKRLYKIDDHFFE